MDNNKFNEIVNSFLKEFNEMCSSTRKDFLLRERVVNYESGSSVKRYNITHRVKRKNNTWTIEAVSSGFWIFKKRFLLLRITRNRRNVNFSGLFTPSISNFKDSEIEEKLKEYLKTCKALPQNIFVKS